MDSTHSPDRRTDDPTPPVNARGSARVKVSLPGTLRSSLLAEAVPVEIADLTTSGARIRGVELSVDTQVSLEFVPPGRMDMVSVRALVVHANRGADRPWLGVRFRLVALRGGR